MEISDLLDKSHSFAIVGASNNEEKYGYKIFRQLKDKGLEVYPVNPREELIQGEKSYDNIYELPKKVDVINFVVPPEVSAKVTQSAFDLGYKIFWYQPGSYNPSVLALHDGKDTQVIKDQCLLIESGKIKD